MKTPIAKTKTFELEKHGNVRIDPYYWLRDRENPEVIDYVKAENDWTDHIMSPTKELQKELYQEMRGRIKEDDQSAPYFKNGYWYYARYEEGKEHAIYCRKKTTMDAPELILLDENELAEDYDYYEIVAYSVTRDNLWMAFTEDITGRRIYRIRFKNLMSGEILTHQIEGCGSDLAWHNDNRLLYFSKKDADTLRPYLIQSFDRTSGLIKDVYEEKDDTYIVNLDKSADFKYIFIGSHSTLTTEFRFKTADQDDDFQVFLERKIGHEYYPESAGDSFIIKTNLSAKNFKLVQTPDHKNRESDHWIILRPHDSAILLEDFEVFESHIAIQEKENGLSRILIMDRSSQTIKTVPFSEETYMVFFGENATYEAKAVRIGYSSMTTPTSVIDIDFSSLDQTLIKQKIVLGDFDPNDYITERTWAKGHDGVKIPVSLVYRKSTFKKEGKQPLLLYAYGSYGATIDPYFSSARLSLLDRGFVFAIAHIRGGEYLGTNWYESGKLLLKKNTFEDFISAAEHLVKEGYADKNQVFAMGGSAGGLLMGAIANMRPDLWKGIVSQVPFVDVVTTMLDDTIPLTTGEYDEWGNPNQKAYYDYMLSYSPYDQLEAKAYPAMLITSGLHDSQVQYWEPTKYVAKLRQIKTDNQPLLLRTNMDAGHGGASGRFESLKELAEEYAFIIALDLLK